MRTLLLVVFCLIAFIPIPMEPAIAADDTELGLSGSYYHADNAPAVWSLTGQALFHPWKGPVLIGPSFGVGDTGDEDLSFLGGAVEVHLTGDDGLYVGAQWVYFIDSPDPDADDSLTALAGVEWNVGKSAFIRFQAEQVIDGVGDDGSLIGTIGVGARF